MKKFWLLFIILTGCQTLFAGNLKILSLDVVNRADGDSLMPWVDRSTDLCLTLHKSKASIIALQNMDSLQIEDVKEGLPEYTITSTNTLSANNGKYTNPILFDKKTIRLVDKGTFWISNTPDIASCTWNTDKQNILCWAMLQEIKTGKSILLVNAHIYDLPENDKQRAATFIKNYLSKMTNKTPVILLGNFCNNCTGVFYTSILQRYFVLHDCYHVAKTKGESSSLNALYPQPAENKRTDFTFIGTGIKAISMNIESSKRKNGYLSNHNLIIAELSLK